MREKKEEVVQPEVQPEAPLEEEMGDGEGQDQPDSEGEVNQGLQEPSPPRPYHAVPTTREECQKEMVYQHEVLDRLKVSHDEEKAWLDRLINLHNRLPVTNPPE